MKGGERDGREDGEKGCGIERVPNWSHKLEAPEPCKVPCFSIQHGLIFVTCACPLLSARLPPNPKCETFDDVDQREAYQITLYLCIATLLSSPSHTSTQTLERAVRQILGILFLSVFIVICFL